MDSLMHAAETPSSRALERLRAVRMDRDRFVALAFCWADLLFELDRDGTIVFASGAVQSVLRADPGQIIGLPFRDLVVREDRHILKLAQTILNKHGRVDEVSLRLRAPGGPTPPLALAGHRMAELDNHFFLAVHSRDRLTLSDGTKHRVARDSLYDAGGFAQAAKELLQDNADANRMTLVSLAGIAARKDQLSDDQRQDLEQVIGTFLRAVSANGDAAGMIGSGRYGLVHDIGLDVNDIRHGIREIVQRHQPDCDLPAVETATLDLDGSLDEHELAQGVLYAINTFHQANRPEFTLRNLGSQLSTLARDAAATVDGFKRMINASDFRMAFQPVIDARTGGAHHFEALARFNGKMGEAPFRYITFAEETGLIVDFDLAMAEKAIAWLADSADRQVRVAVNMSGKSIASARYADTLIKMLSQAPVTRDRLIFEITESAQVTDLVGANQVVQRLRQSGHAVCLDDFGAGAASFRYLSVMEVDVVKLDGDAIHQAMEATKGKAFMTALTTLCRNLDVHTVAEMIDSPELLSFVRGCGVDYVQGYLLGRPNRDRPKYDPGAVARYFPRSPEAE